MKTWHFYDKASGIISGASFSGGLVDLAAQLAHKGDAIGAIADVADYLSQRVDLVTGELVDFQPPAPADSDLVTYGWDTGAKRWVATQTSLALADETRDLRNQALAACDWTQVGDSPLPATAKAAWQAYRSALRDLPEQPGFPSTVNWPTQPA